MKSLLGLILSWAWRQWAELKNGQWPFRSPYYLDIAPMLAIAEHSRLAIFAIEVFVTRAKLTLMPRGFFITFEGLDGSGKTTQLRRLASHLIAQGHTVVTLRNPGSTPLGEGIRNLLLDSRSEASVGPIAPIAELALMFADRAQSIAEIILPALATGSIVLCDRFTDSSEAYQGAGRQLTSARVLALHAALCDNLQPDLTILLLPSLQTSLNRARRRNTRNLQIQGTDENRFETESDEFHARIHAAYLAIAVRDPQRVLTLTGDASIDILELHIRHAVQCRIQALAL